MNENGTVAPLGLVATTCVFDIPTVTEILENRPSITNNYENSKSVLFPSQGTNSHDIFEREMLFIINNNGTSLDEYPRVLSSLNGLDLKKICSHISLDFSKIPEGIIDDVIAYLLRSGLTILGISRFTHHYETKSFSKVANRSPVTCMIAGFTTISASWVPMPRGSFVEWYVPTPEEYSRNSSISAPHHLSKKDGRIVLQQRPFSAKRISNDILNMIEILLFSNYDESSFVADNPSNFDWPNKKLAFSIDMLIRLCVVVTAEGVRNDIKRKGVTAAAFNAAAFDAFYPEVQFEKEFRTKFDDDTLKNSYKSIKNILTKHPTDDSAEVKRSFESVLKTNDSRKIAKNTLENLLASFSDSFYDSYRFVFGKVGKPSTRGGTATVNFPA